MKTFVCSALAAHALAWKENFPKDDANHSNCHLTAQFDGKTCADVYKLMNAKIHAWCVDCSPPQGRAYYFKE